MFGILRNNFWYRGQCTKIDIVLANQIKERKDYALYPCLNSLTDAAVPIRVDDEIIGNLINLNNL